VRTQGFGGTTSPDDTDSAPPLFIPAFEDQSLHGSVRLDIYFDARVHPCV
jgi:hypothetical protein